MATQADVPTLLWPCRQVVAAVSAGSAGVHAALVPAHIDEHRAGLAVSFAVAAGLCALVALTVRDPRHDRWAPSASFLVLAGTAAAYLAAVTVGLPLLQPTPEETDLLGVLTTAAEAIGAVGSLILITGKDQS